MTVSRNIWFHDAFVRVGQLEESWKSMGRLTQAGALITNLAAGRPRMRLRIPNEKCRCRRCGRSPLLDVG